MATHNLTMNAGIVKPSDFATRLMQLTAGCMAQDGDVVIVDDDTRKRQVIRAAVTSGKRLTVKLLSEL